MLQVKSQLPLGYLGSLSSNLFLTSVCDLTSCGYEVNPLELTDRLLTSDKPNTRNNAIRE